MEYIVQFFTGGWEKATYNAKQIIERLNFLTGEINIKKVILGWNIDSSIYTEANAYLKNKGIDSLLWLPVFSETGELRESDEAVDFWGHEIGNLALQEGENFTFYCPSSERNIQNVIDIYEKYFKECGFDGVFLDKIRSQSFVGGVSGVISCGCGRCQGIYKDKGISVTGIAQKYEIFKDAFFDTEDDFARNGFKPLDNDAMEFFKVKSEIISSGVQRLCRYFKGEGMQVGLDLYAPFLSGFVGQDYESIAKEADFIKPMMYRMTEAPAGIKYEYELLKKSIPGAKGYGDLTFDDEFIKEQMAGIKGLSCQKYPGVEINYREDIARTNPEYIKRSIKAFCEGGADGAVLSWDVMLAPDSHIRAVRELLEIM
ncbi:MAG: hypothetical protein J5537_02060 [Lachnospiraceae bacterium]|nr:hypothetical protein [Lachnospiraceae bacterium]